MTEPERAAEARLLAADAADEMLRLLYRMEDLAEKAASPAPPYDRAVMQAEIELLRESYDEAAGRFRALLREAEGG